VFISAQSQYSPVGYCGIPWGSSITEVTDSLINYGCSVVAIDTTVGLFSSKQQGIDISIFCKFTKSNQLAEINIYFDREQIKPLDDYNKLKKEYISQYGQPYEYHDYTKEKDVERESFLAELDPVSRSLQEELITIWKRKNGDEIKLILTLNKSLYIVYSSIDYYYFYDVSKKEGEYIKR